MKYIADKNLRLGEKIIKEEDVEEITGIKNVPMDFKLFQNIPGGFGSYVKIAMENSKITGINREMSKNDQPLVLSYLKFLEKEFGNNDNFNEIRSMLIKNGL